MPSLRFTPQLQRFTATPEIDTEECDLCRLLELGFRANPRLRSYVCDEQGQLRPNVALFIDGRRCLDPRAWPGALRPDSQVYVLQALSGG